MEFYPSVTEDLLVKAIEHAKQHVEISEENIETIMHARKSLLFNKDYAWVKKDNESTFDVTMGSYDRAKVCELVGIYILSKLQEKYGDAQTGLYRDDGLAAFNNQNVVAFNSQNISNSHSTSCIHKPKHLRFLY